MVAAGWVQGRSPGWVLLVGGLVHLGRRWAGLSECRLCQDGRCDCSGHGAVEAVEWGAG